MSLKLKIIIEMILLECSLFGNLQRPDIYKCIYSSQRIICQLVRIGLFSHTNFVEIQIFALINRAWLVRCLFAPNGFRRDIQRVFNLKLIRRQQKRKWQISIRMEWRKSVNSCCFLINKDSFFVIVASFFAFVFAMSLNLFFFMRVHLCT